MMNDDDDAVGRLTSHDAVVRLTYDDAMDDSFNHAPHFQGADNKLLLMT